MRVQHTIRIDAPVSRVWAVTLDVEKWPEWSPTMQSIKRQDEGPITIESKALVKQPSISARTWTVTVLEDEKVFTWDTRMLGMSMSATHRLEPSGDGTENELEVSAGGLTAYILWPLLRFSVKRALRQENEGLKARCEGTA